jgi:hypothetical protein
MLQAVAQVDTIPAPLGRELTRNAHSARTSAYPEVCAPEGCSPCMIQAGGPGTAATYANQQQGAITLLAQLGGKDVEQVRSEGSGEAV